MHRTLRRVAGTALLVLTLGTPAAAHASATDSSWYKEPDVDATWTEAYIPSTDGVMLHADILRPAGLKATDKTPVILSEGPYFGHAGEVGPAGPVEDTDYDQTGPPGPSRRFQDFVVGAHLMQKGYTFVMVDLRGFGGSSGCLDWGGPGEQADVKSGVEWAANAPWSTGKVGMYGKSYDAVTGLMGIAQQPKGLAAVVAQEPVFDLYRYLYSNSVKFENAAATPALYDAIAGTPGTTQDSTDYLSNSVNDTSTPACPVQNSANQSTNDDHTAAYWKARDLIAETKGKATPTFLTQGFLENNTKPDGAWDFYNSLTGPKRAWFGMWDHIRGNETAEGTSDTPVWFDQVMRFYDHYVAGKSLADAPTDKDPNVQVQTQDGLWRNEQSWPPADKQDYAVKLNTGTYTDNGMTDGSGDGLAGLKGDAPGAQGVWTFSPPLASAAHFSGVPRVKLDLSELIGAPDVGMAALTNTNVNVAVDVYDVDQKGVATILSRTAAEVPADGKLDLGMYGNDWKIAGGHRIGVLVTDENPEWYTASVPSGDMVTINSASITLPFLTYTRTDYYKVKVPERLGTFLADAPFTIPAATITGGTSNAFAPPTTVAAPPATTVPVTTPPSSTDPGTTTTPPSTTEPGTTTTPPSTTEPGTTTTPPSSTDPGPTTTPASTTPPATTTPATSTTPPAAATAPLTTPVVVAPKTVAAAERLTVRVAVPRGHGTRRIHVTGRAPAGSTVLVHVTRNGKTVKTIRVKASTKGRYVADLVVRRTGAYSARVSARGAASRLKAISRRVAVHLR